MKVRITVPVNIEIIIHERLKTSEVYDLITDIKNSGASCSGSDYSWDIRTDKIPVRKTVKAIKAINPTT